jgi:cytochrome c oxidase accessory protein FixG
MFAATMIATLIILLDFGWFREQFCIIACPYGRIQSVMMDENSLVVAYDTKRGEPRRGTVDRAAVGDCVNCYNCVKVCPTGIDIRRGTQLECIACTQCIDACDDIMTKLKKPIGLIRYSSENELRGGVRKIVTARSVVYLIAALVFVSSFVLFFRSSTHLNIVMLRGQGSPFLVSSDSLITNHFTVRLKHQGGREFKIELQSQDPDVRVTQPISPWKIQHSEVKNVVFFRFEEKHLMNGSRTFRINLFDHLSPTVVATKEVHLVGPVE